MLWKSVEYATIDADDPRALDHIRNPHFNFFTLNNEQDLLNSMVAEAVQFGGLEFYYIKRDTPNVDLIFGEDTTNKFSQYWKIAAYLDTYDGYQGQGDLFSKFGLSVQDEATLIVQPELFSHQTEPGFQPRLGDLLLWNHPTATAKVTLFEIIWVEPNNPFQPNGTLPFRRINVQKFAYSSESIDLTNMSIIPDNTDLPVDVLDELVELSVRHDDELIPYQETDQIQREGDKITVFTENDPFGAIY